jgi:autotransporter-associated beta strand protein
MLTFPNPNSTDSGTININAGTLNLVGSENYSINRNVVHLATLATLDVTQLTDELRFGGDPSTRLVLNDGDLLNDTGAVKGGLRVESGGTVYPGQRCRHTDR